MKTNAPPAWLRIVSAVANRIKAALQKATVFAGRTVRRQPATPPGKISPPAQRKGDNR